MIIPALVLRARIRYYMRVRIRDAVKMSILLADGEQVIRKYKCVSADYASSDRTLDSMGIGKRKTDTDGTVVVTNRRVIYYAESKRSKNSDMPSMHLQEAFVDRIASTEFVQAEAKRNLLLPFALAVIGLLGLVAGILADTNLAIAVPGAILLALGVVLILLSVKGRDKLVMMKVNTMSSETGVRVSGMSRKDEQSMAFYMVPTAEFKVMATELGAIIADLQKSGDACIPRWTSQ